MPNPDYLPIALPRTPVHEHQLLAILSNRKETVRA